MMSSCKQSFHYLSLLSSFKVLDSYLFGQCWVLEMDHLFLLLLKVFGH
jgi:hypothetical protein